MSMDKEKPLEDWTLKECKDRCEKEEFCRYCPLASLCDEWGFGIPKVWPLGG